VRLAPLSFFCHTNSYINKTSEPGFSGFKNFQDNFMHSDNSANFGSDNYSENSGQISPSQQRRYTMRTKLNKIALAIFGLAITLTLSCSSGGGDDPDNGGGCPNATVGTNTLSCGGKTYKTVNIGEQVWMAENLNYNASGSVCYNYDPSNCDKYGRLYNWATAKIVCPAGWHLPSDAEWDALMTAVGGSSIAGTKLKSRNGWNNNGNGTDESGFRLCRMATIPLAISAMPASTAVGGVPRGTLPPSPTSGSWVAALVWAGTATIRRPYYQCVACRIERLN
jgi:hypothetical protein